MAEKNYGSVVIVDNKQKVVGIVTERDILKKLVKNNKSPKTTKLEEIMTANPRVAYENDDVIDWWYNHIDFCLLYWWCNMLLL